VIRLGTPAPNCPTFAVHEFVHVSPGDRSHSVRIWVVGLTKVHAERKPSSPPINPEKEAKKIVFSDIRILSYRDTDVPHWFPLAGEH